jgi:L-amino acid N-acyltransferase YncA
MGPRITQRAISQKKKSLTGVRIRRATLSDSSQIAEIYNQGIEGRMATFETELRTERTIRDLLIDHQRKNQPVLVAACLKSQDKVETTPEQGLVIGWVSISTYRARACYSGIGEFSIYVRNGYRDIGIGKKLLFALTDEARKLGYWKILSRIFVLNATGRKLCKKCGFREVGVYEKHAKLDGKWSDTVIVEKLIHENLD